VQSKFWHAIDKVLINWPNLTRDLIKLTISHFLGAKELIHRLIEISFERKVYRVSKYCVGLEVSAMASKLKYPRSNLSSYHN